MDITNVTYITSITGFTYWPIFVVLFAFSLFLLIMSHMLDRANQLWAALSWIVGIGVLGSSFGLSNITYVAASDPINTTVTQITPVITPLASVWIILICVGYFVMCSLNLWWIWVAEPMEEVSEEAAQVSPEANLNYVDSDDYGGEIL